MNLIFRPVGLIAGLLAGMVARRIFDQAWKLVDEEDPPGPDVRDIPKVKFVISLALQGIIFGVVRGIVDHYTRAGFARYTGVWPGEDNRGGF
jgi:hypothetical protein